MTSAIPKTGDASAAMAIASGVAGASLVGAGLAGMKRKKNETDEKIGESLEPDLSKPKDDYEAIAEAWVNSEARNEWLAKRQAIQQNRQKGKTR